jgi:hypothetical protein
MQVNITYYGMEGTGRNVTDAKRDAGAKIERALSGDYTPDLVSYRGQAILIYRTPGGWNSCVLSDSAGLRNGPCYGTTYPGSYSREDVIREAREHLAQLTWTPEDGLIPPPFLKDRRSLSDYKTWAEFQLRYREARTRGMDDNDAHSFAARNPQRPELWKEPA